MMVSAYAEPMAESYPRPRFGAPREPVPAGDEPARYAAYALRHDGAVTWADLGEAAPIDAAVPAGTKVGATAADKDIIVAIVDDFSITSEAP